MLRNEPKLRHYCDLLHQWQKTINLVSPSTLEDVWTRHITDSAQLVEHISQTVKTICDIGSGAGFPGLVLAIERPDIAVHLVESDARKCAFLRTVSRETQCDNVTIHTDRIERVMPTLKADMVTARALAPLSDLIGYSADLWRQNPSFTLLVLKGAQFEDEIATAHKKYNFDYQTYPSVTNKDARILLVGNMCEKTV